MKQIRIPTELAGKLATVLRESQTDQEKFVRASMLRLQQQQMLLRSKLDRVYEDRLSDAIPEELWNSKSAALQDELRRVRTEMAAFDRGSLSPTYVKPFDVFAKGSETGVWLLGLDSTTFEPSEARIDVNDSNHQPSG